MLSETQDSPVLRVMRPWHSPFCHLTSGSAKPHILQTLQAPPRGRSLGHTCRGATSARCHHPGPGPCVASYLDFSRDSKLDFYRTLPILHLSSILKKERKKREKKKRHRDVQAKYMPTRDKHRPGKGLRRKSEHTASSSPGESVPRFLHLCLGFPICASVSPYVQ